MQRRLDGDVVDAGREDLAGVVIEQIGLAMTHRVVSLQVVVSQEALQEEATIECAAAMRAIERWIAIMSDSC